MAVGTVQTSATTRPRRQRGESPQGSLFDEVVDLEAVRARLGLEGCFRLAMQIREHLLRTSAMCRDMDLEVFDRHAERLIDAALCEIGRREGLFLVAPG